MTFITLFLGVFGSAQAQSGPSSGSEPTTAPPAGTAIRNRAYVTLDVGNQPVRIDSNEVSVSVTGVPGLSLVPDITRAVTPGASVSLAHRLTNTGNIATAYSLQVVSLSGDNYDLSQVQLFRDANNNGVFDSGETAFDPSQPVYLSAGQSADFVISGIVPVSIVPGAVSRTRLTATVAGPAPGAPPGDFSPLSASVVDTLTSVSGASVAVRKSASTGQSTPGSEVTFNVVAQNSGTISPAPQNVLIDGALRQFVLLRDRIPTNTTFVEFAPPPFGTVRLFHRAGDTIDSYVSQQSADVGQIDGIALAMPSIAPNSSVALSFRVRINPGASDFISNVARLTALDAANNSLSEVLSNEVRVTLPNRPPTLNYYTGINYNLVAGVTSVGRPLYLQGNASACNQDPGLIESVQLKVRSELTGDTVTYTALETGPNTGIFRVITPIPTSGGAVDSSNATLEIRANDQLDAILEDCGGARAIADILVDPFGVVFDSRTNAPVAGARVTLIDVTGAGNGGNAGGPARVFDVDGITPFPATLITGADGRFQYPLAAGSTYRLAVEPPAGFSFPSRVSIFLLPPSRRIDPSGSFGGNFIVNTQTGAVQIDVPLDPPPPTGLFLQKTASRRTAEIADFVDYEVRLRNTTGTLLNSVTLTDVLPRGFSLVGGSSRLGGVKISDPQGAPGLSLRYTFGDLLPDAEIRLTYRVRLGAGISSGDQFNRAQAVGTTPTGNATSNTASAPVRVSAGLLTERAILFGKVFVDTNKNRLEDKGEPGVPGVRVWVEDGTYAVTDSDGKYSIYGLTARTHVAKADRVTLPLGAILESLTVRHGGRGDSAFADLKKGEMHKVNFALIEPTETLLAEVEKRRKAGDPFAAESNSALSGDLRRSIDDVLPDARALPASGTMTAAGPLASVGAGFDTLNPGASNSLNTSQNGNNAGTFSAAGNVFTPNPRLNQNNSNLSRPNELRLPDSPATTYGSAQNLATQLGGKSDADLTVEAARELAASTLPTSTVEGGAAQFEAFIKGMDNSFVVLSPRDGETLSLDQANIRLKGLGGATFSLKVNGEIVPESRIGARLTDATRQLQAFEYVGVHFNAGDNLIEAAQLDPFGNERGHVVLHVIVPGRAGKIIIEAAKTGQSADGVTPVPVTIRIVDDKGLPVTSRTPVTLETVSGRFDTPDLNSNEPGTQIFVEGGVIQLDLLPPAEPGDGLIRALSGTIEARQKLSFVPELRPLIAVGSLEGGVNFFNFNPQGVSGDLFEDDLKGLFNKTNGNTKISSRAALFLKGRVLGKNLLTLRYDSQTTRDRLFRDIQPDEYYPVYGDGGLKGFDAQSTGRLYIRLDRDRNYFLFGDFTTASTTQFNTLGNYQRALNGGRQHIENDRYTLDFFAARDNGTQIVDEIRANGTSGGYVLRSGNLTANSERVEIIVRDRNNLGVILEVRPQTRFRDYEFDFATGRLLFRSPISSVDANFNPISIRVFYNVDNGGPKYWVQGVNGAVKLTPNLEIGGSLVRDDAPQDNLNLSTLNATFKAGEHTTVSAELARTQRDSLGKGNGSRLEVLHDSERLQARFFAGRTSTGFDNPGSILSRGRGEISLRAAWRLDSRTRFLAEALRTTDTSTSNSRTGLQAAVEREFGRIRAEFGVRHVSESDPATANTLGATPIDFTSLRARLTVPVGQKANAFGEYESDISDTSRRVLALGGDYRLSDRSRVYARHEFISSLDGRYALNSSQEQQNTIFGIDSSYSPSGHLFSEYRMRGALSGREGQAAIGLRDAWVVKDGVRVTGGFERTKSMGSSLTSVSNDSTALTGGLEYTRSEDFKGTARVELRQSGNSNSVLATLGTASRLNKEFTMLSRGVFNVQRGRNGGSNAAQHRFQLGLAYRDRDDDRWSGLAKYEFRQTKNGTAAGAFLPGDGSFAGGNNGTVHLLSVDANYQKSARLTLSGHYGAKFNADTSNGLSSTTWAQLVSARAIYELNRKTEVSAQAGALVSQGSGVQYGWGAELGRLIGRDLWLSAGYNFGAVSDGDLTGSGFTRRGPYLRIRFKFDESLFNGREAQLLAKSDEKTETRIVQVPVIGIDPQTQAKTPLPVTAEVEVAKGTPDPQSVEIDVPQTMPVVTADIAPVVALNPRINEASGRKWEMVIQAPMLSYDEGGYLAAQSKLRRAALTSSEAVTKPVPVKTRELPAVTTPFPIEIEAPNNAEMQQTVQRNAANAQKAATKIAPRRAKIASRPRRQTAHRLRHQAAVKVPKKVKIQRKVVHNRAWWLK